MNTRNSVILLLPVVLTWMGCTSPMTQGTIFEYKPRPDPQVAQMAVNTRQINLEYRQLAEQMTMLAHNLEAVEALLTRLESQSMTPAVVNDDIVALRRDIQMLRNERDELRKEITSDLAGRIEKVAARQQAALLETARAGSAAASGARGSGYEHKVERGQTL